MSGRASKSKGNRLEYEVRDYMRKLGWDAYRVPASGAAEGFKGDVVATLGEQKLVFEVKARRESFKSIYHLVNKSPIKVQAFWHSGYCIHMSYDLVDLLVDHVVYDKNAFPEASYRRPLNKLIHMSDWLKGSDILVVKDNHKPLLFIKYLVPHVSVD